MGPARGSWEQRSEPQAGDPLRETDLAIGRLRWVVVGLWVMFQNTNHTYFVRLLLKMTTTGFPWWHSG